MKVETKDSNLSDTGHLSANIPYNPESKIPEPRLYIKMGLFEYCYHTMVPLIAA
jgi:hypothetical protein